MKLNQYLPHRMEVLNRRAAGSRVRVKRGWANTKAQLLFIFSEAVAFAF
jgi:hypothetical protein